MNRYWISTLLFYNALKIGLTLKHRLVYCGHGTYCPAVGDAVLNDCHIVNGATPIGVASIIAIEHHHNSAIWPTIVC